jgi:hypothetical protein
MTTFDVYIYGMVKACEARGVDPVGFIKNAQLFPLVGIGSNQQSNYETANWRRAQKARTWLGRGWANTKRDIGEWWADDKAEWKARTDQADQIAANEGFLRRLRDQTEAKTQLAAQKDEMDQLRGIKKPSTPGATGGSGIPGGDIFYDPQYGRASGRYEYGPTRAYLSPMAPATNLDGTPRAAAAPATASPATASPAPAAPAPPAPPAPAAAATAKTPAQVPAPATVQPKAPDTTKTSAPARSPIPPIPYSQGKNTVTNVTGHI